MNERMTICNMSIEAGGKAGLVAPDDTTYQFLAGRSFAPKGKAWDEALVFWRTLPSDHDAEGDASDRDTDGSEGHSAGTGGGHGVERHEKARGATM